MLEMETVGFLFYASKMQIFDNVCKRDARGTPISFSLQKKKRTFQNVLNHSLQMPERKWIDKMHIILLQNIPPKQTLPQLTLG